MPEAPDYDLLKTPEESPVVETLPPSRQWLVPVILTIAIGVIAGGLFYYYTRRPAPAAPTVAKSVAPAPSDVRPLGGPAEPITVPSLDQSDQVVRDLVRRITAHPDALTWLATRGLVRQFTVVVENVGTGDTPARHLSVLRPSSPFRVVERNGQLFIDPRSYERYNRLADAAASIDLAGAARVYGTLKPRIEEAYGELGMPPTAFDRALERAIVSLLQTPVVADPIRVEPKGGVAYQYADPKLESLTAAQKHLLRTGPRNVRVVQSALRQLAISLGVASDRLPAAR